MELVVLNGWTSVDLGWIWLRYIQNGLFAPTDHPGCIPPRSNQDPLRSSHLEPPRPEMPVLWHFRASYGHKIGIKGQILMSTNWISTPPDPTDEMQPLVSLFRIFFVKPSLKTKNIRQKFLTDIFQLEISH